MDEVEQSPPKPPGRHLISRETLAGAADAGGNADLTRTHGQGNGVRMHSIYFAIVSLVALALVIASIAFATTMM